MKVIKYKCAICDKEYDFIPDKSIIVSAKRQWYDWTDAGKIRTKLLICPDCQEKIKELVKKHEID